jgi:hypothetical protein
MLTPDAEQVVDSNERFKKAGKPASLQCEINRGATDPPYTAGLRPLRGESR